MTETEIRQFLVKNLTPHGFDVQRNESGSVNEGYPDLTISKNNKTFLLELKQCHIDRKDRIVLAKFQPRQKGKMALLATAQKVRVLGATFDKHAFLVSSPSPKILFDAPCVKWSGTLDRECDLHKYLDTWMEAL